MTSNKYNVILFHDLSCKSKAANIYSQYQLVKLLKKNNSLNKVYCLNATVDSKFLSEHVVALNKNLFYKILNWVIIKLYRTRSRSKRESLFEEVVLRMIIRDGSSNIYMSKPLFPKLIKHANKQGVKSYVRASVANPKYNYDLIINEEKKFKVNNTSTYSDSKRVTKIQSCLKHCTHLMINCRTSKNNFLLKTYENYNEKIVKYECMYLLLPFVLKPQSTITTPLKFIHVSHGSLIKGIPYLLEAWKTYKMNTDTLSELHIIGSFDPSIQEIVNNDYSNLKQYYHYESTPNPFELIDSPCAFINMSLSEAGPSTIAESLSKGIPVITSKNCGLSDLISDGQNGFTFEYNDTTKLVQHLTWFDNNKPLINKMKKNAKRSYNKYDLNFFHKEFENIFIK